MSLNKHIVMVLDNPFVSDMRVRKEAMSLLEAGFEVTIVCTTKKGLEREDHIHGIKLMRILDDFVFHPLRSGYAQKVDRAAKDILALTPLVVHCHDFNTLDIGAAVKRHEPHTFLTYDTHEYFRKWLIYQDIPGWLNRLKGWVVWKFQLRQERKNIRMVNALITASTEIGQALVGDYKISLTPISVHNIPDLTKNPDYKDDIRSILNIPHDIKIMVQSGNIYQTDAQLNQMFEAVCGMENLCFVLIGNRPRFYEVKEWVHAKRAYAGNILFIDYDEAHLFNLLESADFGILYMKTDVWESHRITSPNRIMEYSMVGIPFLSVDQVASKQLDDDFGIVSFYDLNKKGSMEDALHEMISKLDEKQAKAKRIASTLDWNKDFKWVVRLYETLLKAN